jgi:hypothetical protein
MMKGGKGGKNPLINGLRFEKRMDLASRLAEVPGYSVENDVVFFKGKKVAELYKKYKLYKKFLEPKGVDARKIVSKLLLPDDAIFVLATQTLFIIEQKYQDNPGSVDEKVQTCDFKNRQYKKLMAPLGITVQYTYVLCEWFNVPAYQDVLEYIKMVGCNYFFEVLPLDFLGLPIPTG